MKVDLQQAQQELKSKDFQTPAAAAEQFTSNESNLQQENTLLRQKTETLEKKVDSLVKFLENERRLRHEFEEIASNKDSHEGQLKEQIKTVGD